MNRKFRKVPVLSAQNRVRKSYIRSAADIPADLTKEARIRLFGKDPQGEIEIPYGVTSIGEGAFEGCTSLTRVTIPDSVTSIGEDAFIRCHGLTSVTIPDSVTKIGKYACGLCESLKSVKIPYGVPSIGSGTFFWCESLTSITIPDSVTYIGYSAFDGCKSLTSITIPDSVTEIGKRAFSHCMGLTSVTILNDQVKIGPEAFDGTPVANQFQEAYTESQVQEAPQNHTSSALSWKRVLSRLQKLQEQDETVYNIIYEYPDDAAVERLIDLMGAVGDSMGVWLEGSVQGSLGIYMVYDKDDNPIAQFDDYEEFDAACVDLALECNSANEFKSKYKALLQQWIDENPYEE